MIYIVYIHSFYSEVALNWDSKHFNVIFKISRIQITAQRSLLCKKEQVFYTAWGKCPDTGIFEITM
jgi:hypothetical protein